MSAKNRSINYGNATRHYLSSWQPKKIVLSFFSSSKKNCLVLGRKTLLQKIKMRQNNGSLIGFPKHSTGRKRTGTSCLSFNRMRLSRFSDWHQKTSSIADRVRNAFLYSYKNCKKFEKNEKISSNL